MKVLFFFNTTQASFTTGKGLKPPTGSAKPSPTDSRVSSKSSNSLKTSAVGNKTSTQIISRSTATTAKGKQPQHVATGGKNPQKQQHRGLRHNGSSFSLSASLKSSPLSSVGSPFEGKPSSASKTSPNEVLKKPLIPADKTNNVAVAVASTATAVRAAPKRRPKRERTSMGVKATSMTNILPSAVVLSQKEVEPGPTGQGALRNQNKPAQGCGTVVFRPAKKKNTVSQSTNSDSVDHEKLFPPVDVDFGNASPQGENFGGNNSASFSVEKELSIPDERSSRLFEPSLAAVAKERQQEKIGESGRFDGKKGNMSLAFSLKLCFEFSVGNHRSKRNSRHRKNKFPQQQQVSPASNRHQEYQ